MSDFVAEGLHGQPCVVEYNSPILTVSERYDIVPRLERELFEHVLGTKMDRSQERISGLYKCVFCPSLA
jgi:predicted ArsR family transcriptional regulator